jgi:hypothetical protein
MTPGSHITSSSSSKNTDSYFGKVMSSSSTSQQSVKKVGSNNNVVIDNDNALAGLSCDAYGGPSNDVAQEMVYWKDIPSDRYEKTSTYTRMLKIVFVLV